MRLAGLSLTTVSILMLLTVSAHAELVWVTAQEGLVPDGAIVGGHERSDEQLVVCRAAYQGGIHPGKMGFKWRSCSIGWGGDEIGLRSYDVLVGGPVVWILAAGGQVPPDAVVAGQEHTGELLYICSAEFQGGVHSGKVRQGFDGCSIGWAGKEYFVPTYKVLAVPR